MKYSKIIDKKVNIILTFAKISDRIDLFHVEFLYKTEVVITIQGGKK